MVGAGQSKRYLASHRDPMTIHRPVNCRLWRAAATPADGTSTCEWNLRMELISPWNPKSCHCAGRSSPRNDIAFAHARCRKPIVGNQIMAELTKF